MDRTHYTRIEQLRTFKVAALTLPRGEQQSHAGREDHEILQTMCDKQGVLKNEVLHWVWGRQHYLELLSQFGGQLVAGELLPGHLVVLDQLLAGVSAPLQAILIRCQVCPTPAPFAKDHPVDVFTILPHTPSTCAGMCNQLLLLLLLFCLSGSFVLISSPAGSSKRPRCR